MIKICSGQDLRWYASECERRHIRVKDMVLDRRSRGYKNEILKILLKASLSRVTLKECFHEGSELRDALSSIAQNRITQCISLDIRDNTYISGSTPHVVEIIQRRMVKSLQLPGCIEVADMKAILQALYDFDLTLETLSINKCNLDALCIQYLKHLIRNKKVTKRLDAEQCYWKSIHPVTSIIEELNEMASCVDLDLRLSFKKSIGMEVSPYVQYNHFPQNHFPPFGQQAFGGYQQVTPMGFSHQTTHQYAQMQSGHTWIDQRTGFAVMERRFIQHMPSNMNHPHFPGAPNQLVYAQYVQQCYFGSPFLHHQGR